LAPAQARRPQRARGRARVVPLQRAQLPDAQDPPGAGPQRAHARDAAPAVPGRPPPAGHEADGHDHGLADDRADIHLRRQARRGARDQGPLPGAEPAKEPVVLRRPLLAACAAVLLLPAAASAGQFSVAGSTLVYNANAGDVDQISGFDTGTSYRFTRFGGASIGPGPGCMISPDGQTVD